MVGVARVGLFDECAVFDKVLAGWLVWCADCVDGGVGSCACAPVAKTVTASCDVLPEVVVGVGGEVRRVRIKDVALLEQNQVISETDRVPLEAGLAAAQEDEKPD